MSIAISMPYRPRWANEAVARAGGYFWLPCHGCGEPFGGHEWAATLPNPDMSPNTGVGVCKLCAKALRAALDGPGGGVLQRTPTGLSRAHLA